MLKFLPEKFFITLFVLMNYIGLVGYYLGADFYVTPSNEALAFIFFLGLAVILAWIFFAITFMRLNKGGSENYIFSRARYYLTNLGVILLFIVIATYYLIYFQYFPLVQMLFSTGFSESSRPDVVGGVPFYWTFTVIVSSFAIPLAVNFLLLINSDRKSFYYYLRLFFLIAIIIFLATLTGGKSAIIGLIFFFFFMVFPVTYKKIIIFLVLFIFFYFFIKYLYHSSTHEISFFLNFERIFESIIRRVSFINVSSMGVAIDQLLLASNNIPDNFNNIKQFTFYEIYGYLPGGAPVPFVVSSFLWAPIFYIPFLVFFVTFFILAVRFYMLKISPPLVYYAIFYLQFYGAIVLVSGSLFDYFVRSLLPSFLIIISAKIYLSRG